MKTYNKRSITLINETTGQRQDFDSINSAAKFLGSSFFNVQRAAMYNGIIGEWRVYESASSIRAHIDDLKCQLKVLEG